MLLLHWHFNGRDVIIEELLSFLLATLLIVAQSDDPVAHGRLETPLVARGAIGLRCSIAGLVENLVEVILVGSHHIVDNRHFVHVSYNADMSICVGFLSAIFFRCQRVCDSFDLDRFDHAHELLTGVRYLRGWIVCGSLHLHERCAC